MQIIKPSAEIMTAQFGVDVLKKIEMVGRTCYKSTNLITEDSAPRFVGNLIKAGHEAMVEHGSFCFMVSFGQWRGIQASLSNMATHLKQNKEEFLPRLRFTNEGRCLVSGNVRAWREYFLECGHQIGTLPMFFKDFIMSNPVLFPELQDPHFFGGVWCKQAQPIFREDLINDVEVLIHCDVTARFIIDRGVSHELVRHRPASFAQESTRYCNYSKDKFGNELTFVEPCFWDPDCLQYIIWFDDCTKVEDHYFRLLKCGASPEQARDVLNTSIKTEVIMTATCGEWRHFFGLRACNFTGKAHPQMLEVGQPLLDAFKDEFRKDEIFEDMKYR